MLPLVGRSGNQGNQGEGDSPPDSPYSSGLAAYDEGRPGEDKHIEYLGYSSAQAKGYWPRYERSMSPDADVPRA